MNACDSRPPPYSPPQPQGWMCISWCRTAQFQLITAELWWLGHGWSWREAGTPPPSSWPHTEAALSDLHDWRQPLSQQWVIQEHNPPFMLHQLELRVSCLLVFLKRKENFYRFVVHAVFELIVPSQDVHVNISAPVALSCLLGDLKPTESREEFVVCLELYLKNCTWRTKAVQVGQQQLKSWSLKTLFASKGESISLRWTPED